MKNRDIKPSLAVIIPVYWGSKLNDVRQSIDSILLQTYQPEQIVIVCDGEIPAILKRELDRYASQNDCIEIQELKSNCGRGQARNYAASFVTKDLIALMDSDDISRPDRFEKQIEVFMAQSADVVGGIIEEFSECPGDLKRLRNVPITHKAVRSLIPFRTPYNNVTVMFRTDIFRSVGGYKNLNFVEDWDFAVRAIANGARFINISHVLVDVRVNLERKYTVKYLKEELNLIFNLKQTLSVPYSVILFSMFSRIIRKLLPKLFSDWIVYTFLRNKHNNET